MESGLICLSRPVRRNGPILCIGHALNYYSHKIGRICRSSIAAECIAISNVIDQVLRMRALITEIYCGKFYLDSLNPEDPFPILTPFQEQLSEKQFLDRLPSIDVKEKVSVDVDSVSFYIHPSPNRQMIMMSALSELVLVNHCQTCQSSHSILISDLREQYDRQRTSIVPHLHALVVTDFSNCYSSISNVSARCADRTTRLQLSYIRDSQLRVALSFVCGPFNLADTGTKSNNNINLYLKFAASGFFELAFLTRKECRSLLDSRKNLDQNLPETCKAASPRDSLDKNRKTSPDDDPKLSVLRRGKRLI